MIVAEYDIHAVVTGTNRPVVLSFVTVMTVRDGLIVHARDYSNPLAQAEVFGG
jgi:ketosteroid isomerase-like protein